MQITTKISKKLQRIRAAAISHPKINDDRIPEITRRLTKIFQRKQKVGEFLKIFGKLKGNFSEITKLY